MRTTLSPLQLWDYIINLVRLHFPDNYHPDPLYFSFLGQALERLNYCFSHINKKYYRDGNEVIFDHLNGDHLACFLYFLSNSIWDETKDRELPTRLFYLNKIMHGIDLFYMVKMPKIFLLVHPVGTVLGNANYQDYLAVYQNVTVGADEDGIYPSFGEGTLLYAKSTVIGECKLGKNIVLGANSFILNTSIPDDMLVVGQYPHQRILKNSSSVIQRIFNING